jgi:hypothetical protein
MHFTTSASQFFENKSIFDNNNFLYLAFTILSNSEVRVYPYFEPLFTFSEFFLTYKEFFSLAFTNSDEHSRS